MVDNTTHRVEGGVKYSLRPVQEHFTFFTVPVGLSAQHERRWTGTTRAAVLDDKARDPLRQQPAAETSSPTWKTFLVRVENN